MESSPLLPEDVIIEILSRLPVKSIIRFKCVCKTWCSLPRNPRFISKHYRNSKPPENGCGVLDWKDEDACNQLVAQQRFDNGILDFLPLDGQLNFLGLEKKPDTIVGLCDGVFCLHWYETTTEPCVIALWNPATRDYKTLPPSYCEFPPYRRLTACAVGFGRDPQTGDYKVVKRDNFDTVEYGSFREVSCDEVYTLSTDSWRLLYSCVDEDSAFQSVLVGQGICIHIDGVLHWFSYEKEDIDPKAVFSFHMRDEVFRVTPFPNKYNTHRKRVSSDDFKFCMLSLLHGQLSFSCWFYDRRVRRVVSLDVWVMKDYDGGAEEESSWSHLFSITPPFQGFTRAICFWKTGELVCVRDGQQYIRDTGYPVLYDLVTGKTREFQLFGENNFIYKESLVSLKSETAPADDETVLLIQEHT